MHIDIFSFFLPVSKLIRSIIKSIYLYNRRQPLYGPHSLCRQSSCSLSPVSVSASCPILLQQFTLIENLQSDRQCHFGVCFGCWRVSLSLAHFSQNSLQMTFIFTLHILQGKLDRKPLIIATNNDWLNRRFRFLFFVVLVQ